MANNAEHDRIQRLLQKQAPAVDVSAFAGPASPDDADRALSDLGFETGDLFDNIASPFESADLEQETIEAYAMGRCTEEERRMIDAMIEIESRLAAIVAEVRREILRAESWSPPETVTQPDAATAGFFASLAEFFKRPALRYGLEAVLSVGAAALLTVVFLGSRTSSGPQSGPSSTGKPDPKMVALLDKNHQLNDQNSALSLQLKSAQEKLLAAQKVRPPKSTPPPIIAHDGDRSIVSLGGGRVAMVLPGKDPIEQALRGDMHVPGYKPSGIVTMGIHHFELRGSPNRTMSDPNRTTLVWHTPSGHKPERYLLIVSGPGIREQRIGTTGNSWTAPEGLLKPGKLYFWRLTARVDGKDLESSDAEFRTLTEEQSRRAEATLADKTLGHLEKAIRLAELGLSGDAMDQFKQVVWQDHKAEAKARKALFGY